MNKTSMDVITYEVIRNRIIAITEEMRIALQRVSGSPTVTQASDFYTGLCLADGTFATMGFQVTTAAPPVSDSIRYLLREKKVPIRDGDMFVQNDPWIGALHQNDVQMLGPIFWEDEIIAWAGVMAHQTDVGGMDFASWCPKAREVFQEGLRIPAVRLVEQGEVRQDILDFILGASRLPDQLGLDLSAFVATINVARDRLTDFPKVMINPIQSGVTPNPAPEEPGSLPPARGRTPGDRSAPRIRGTPVIGPHSPAPGRRDLAVSLSSSCLASSR